MKKKLFIGVGISVMVIVIAFFYLRGPANIPPPVSGNVAKFSCPVGMNKLTFDIGEETNVDLCQQHCDSLYDGYTGYIKNNRCYCGLCIKKK